MVVEYIDNGKRALFNGYVFCRDDRTGYYYNSNNRLMLHRAVYAFCNGDIPEDFHVHHIDHDRGNNEPDNLIALSPGDHLRLHGREITDERREGMRENLIRNACPVASEWHASDEGHTWHLEHYEQMKDVLHRREPIVCDYCGKEFEGYANSRSRFCSNNCKSAWRRKAGLDDETRICGYCENKYIANKYSLRKYCSNTCAKFARSLHQSEAYSEAAD